MITVWELDPTKREVRQVSVERYQIGKTLSWIDCFQPTDEELAFLSDKTGIALQDFKESLDPDKRPHVIPYDRYSLIIFRAPYEEEGEVLTAPVGVFMFKNDVITIHDKPIKDLEEFRALPVAQRLHIFRKGAPYFVYRFMDAAIGDFFDVMDRVDAEVDAIEEEVLAMPAATVTKKIFVLKRTLIYTHKALIANRDVISALEKHYLGEFKKGDIHEFRDLYNDTAQLIDLVSTYRDILTSILDMYLSSVNNNLNKVMKTLTALSAFIFVPTLIAGIYGMNFQGVSPWNMPELYWKYGYFFALGLMVLSTFVTYLLFRVKGWIDWP